MGAHETLAVYGDDATAEMCRVGVDDPTLERCDERDGLDDGAGVHGRIQDVGSRLASIARVLEIANEERGAVGLRGATKGKGATKVAPYEMAPYDWVPYDYQDH